MELSGKRALITGASRGIGDALARAFAAKGAHVVLVARSAAAIERLAADLGGSAHPTDLADRQAVSTLIDRVEEQGGPVDVLVNNAGVAPMGGAIQNWRADDLEQIYRVNLIAPAELCRRVLPGMLRRGIGSYRQHQLTGRCRRVPRPDRVLVDQGRTHPVHRRAPRRPQAHADRHHGRRARADPDRDARQR